MSKQSLLPRRRDALLALGVLSGATCALTWTGKSRTKLESKPGSAWSLQPTTFLKPESYSFALAWSGDGSHLAATTDFGERVAVFSVESQRELAAFPRLRSNGPRSIALSHDGRFLYSTSSTIERHPNNPVATLWNVATKKIEHQYARPSGIEGAELPFLDLVYPSPDGTYLVVGNSRVCLVYAASGGEFLYSLPVDATNSRTAAISSRNHFALPGRYVSKSPGLQPIDIYDLPTGRALRSFAGHEAGVHAVAFSADGSRLASGAEGIRNYLDNASGENRTSRDDDPIRIWDVASGKKLTGFKRQGVRVDELHWLGNSDRLVSVGAKDEDVRGHLFILWDTVSSSRLLQVTTSASPPNIDVALPSPDGTRIAFSVEKTIEISQLVQPSAK